MGNPQPLVSAARAVLICVRDLDTSRSFYENGLGLSCTGITDKLDPGARSLWGIGDGAVRVARLIRPGDAFGMVELVAWEGNTGEPIRDPSRSWDRGLLTLNFTTLDIERALPQLTSLGARFPSAPRAYEAGGRSIRETAGYAPGGELLTLLQVGETKTESPHPFAGAVATVGIVVPSFEAARAFWCDTLGLTLVLSDDKIGGGFTASMGVPDETRMRMAIMTSGNNWTGKMMVYELTQPGGSAEVRNASERADGRYTGHWMVSFIADDFDDLAEALHRARVPVLRGPVEIDRPFVGPTRAMTIVAPGGTPLEVTAR
jgi:catechol 2,3-dioxygenase-like lactoylglutathione lyase family enzyme